MSLQKLQYTPLEEIEKIHTELKNGFNSGKLKSIAYRKYQLLQLAYMIKDNGQRFEESLKADLGRPPLESQFFEVASCIGDIKNTYTNLDKWVKPEKPAFSLNWTPMRPIIYKEPKGVCLIISPFNYPVWLTVPVLASALAAGNAVVIKPSESTPATSALLAELIHQYLDTSLVRVVNGAIPETTKLLELPWGHILYTGGGRVAKVVSAAAAKTLTPVSLELGGKSPVFIDSSCDLKVAARRILWGKIANAGQTCVAPDYILVKEDFQDTLIAAFKEAYDEFYPNGPKEPGAYSRLCTPQAFKRVNGLLQNTKGRIVLGGEVDEADKYIAPTIVADVSVEDSLMSEDYPLSIYVFTKDEAFKQKVFRNTQSGSAIANETIIHPAAEGLPFGGIGPSGSGYHTGKYGFDMFTHFRSSLDSPSWLEALMSFRYPPYTAKKLATMNRTITPRLPPRPKGPPAPDADSKSGKSWLNWFTLIVAAAFAGGFFQRERVLKAIGQ
ncbi:Hexadecenal dehydrogenase [Paramarasmius palmivorus]|uniref:Aldehyde dehydrogenase n=1 Tax=Paramarasmius palmivorus TaxID=297713 RepID=A0AAW0EAY4_9AGAR